MRRSFRSPLATVILLVTAAPAGAQISIPLPIHFGNPTGSGSGNVSSYDCQGIELKGASGVGIGPVHKYAFAGPCQLLSLGMSDHKVTSKRLEATVWAEASVVWDGKTGEVRETIAITGDRTGSLEMTLSCTKDPIIYTATCVHGQYRNDTGWPGFDLAWLNSHPVTQGGTNGFAALAASAEAAKNTPEPSPAVPPPPRTRPASTVPPDKRIGRPLPMHVVEGEALVPGAIANNGHAAVVQPMATFGTEWSGDRQLFWIAQAVGARLQLRVPLTIAAGRYEVFVAFTRAPDYALIAASFDGQPAVHFNGYATKVSRDRALLGMFDLAPGDHQVTLTVAGKDEHATGYYLGVDRLEFVRR